MWVPVSASEMKKRKRCQSGTEPAAKPKVDAERGREGRVGLGGPTPESAREDGGSSWKVRASYCGHSYASFPVFARQ